MRFAFIDRQREGSKQMTCLELSVSRSGFYAWSDRQHSGEASARQKRHQQLVEQVRLSFLRSRQRYGAPRIAADLLARGTKVCINTVAKILREIGLCAKPRRRFVPRTTDSNHGYGIAPNRLKRCFTIDRMNRVWSGDISYIRTEEGWLYLATLMDLCSRRIVGWATHQKISSELTCSALRMAIDVRLGGRPAPAGLICHSDRGSQYACHAYQQLLLSHGLLCSMSRRGDCYDNAPSESFFATLKGELEIDTYPTRAQAKTAIFEFIEVFYNRKRLHSALGNRSPEQFEATQRDSPNPAPAQRG